MMKKRVALLLIAALLLAAMPAALAGGMSVMGRPDGSLWLTGYSSQEEVVVLPAESDGLPITGIGDLACQDNRLMIELTIPEPIVSIGRYAFLSCDRMEEVHLPGTLRTLEEGAFANCGSLTHVELPEGLEKIGPNAFTCCYQLSAVTVPASVTSIDRTSFAYCSDKLELIVAPGSWAQTFAEQNGLAYTLLAALPEQTLPPAEGGAPAVGTVYAPSIEMSDFAAARDFVRYVEGGFTLAWRAEGSVAAYLVEITDDLGNVYIERQTQDTSMLVNEWLLHPGLVYTARIGAIPVNGTEADAVWSELQFAALEAATPVPTPTPTPVPNPDYDYEVRDNAAWITRYKGLASEVSIPEVLDGWPVRGIANGAFTMNDSITRVVIPGTVTQIGTPLEGYRGFYFVPEAIEEGQVSLDDSKKLGAFEWCENLSEVVIPDSVTAIGEYAFNHCIVLSAVELPYGLTDIGGTAFCGCYSLTEVTLPETVTRIGSAGFASCTGLKNITIPSSVVSIGGSAFYNCQSLESAMIPDSVTNLSTYQLFDECKSLTSVQLPASVTNLGERAFQNCSSLTQLILPAGVTKIDEDALAGCPATLFVKSGSPVEAYLMERGLDFEYTR